MSSRPPSYVPPPVPKRRFPAPWTVLRTDGGYQVSDANGQALAYVYGDDRPKGVADTSLTVDQARRIAAGIVRLPDLLKAEGESKAGAGGGDGR